MTLLTCMGEILFDFLPIEEHGKTVGFRMHPGGAPFNVAVGLARLKQPSAYVTKLSNDFFGRSLRATVVSEGIDTRFLLQSGAPTTLAFVAVEDGEPVFSFYGEGASDTLITPDELPDALFDETNVLHVGSISLLRGTTPDAVLATVERLKGRALISFDPNLRPGLVRDEARYRTLLDKLFALADIVKLSAADIAWLRPGQAVEEVAAELLWRGPALVVVTRGGKGALMLHTDPNNQQTLIPSVVPMFPVQVADTVGAGDAFSGGLLAALAERGVLSRATLLALPDNDLAVCGRFASATAALTCAQAGANPPGRAEVMALLKA